MECGLYLVLTVLAVRPWGQCTDSGVSFPLWSVLWWGSWAGDAGQGTQSRDKSWGAVGGACALGQMELGLEYGCGLLDEVSGVSNI